MIAKSKKNNQKKTFGCTHTVTKVNCNVWCCSSFFYVLSSLKFCRSKIIEIKCGYMNNKISLLKLFSDLIISILV